LVSQASLPASRCVHGANYASFVPLLDQHVCRDRARVLYSARGGNFNKRDDQGRSQPLVGDNVSFGAGAVVIGPIKVGSNSIVGANSVVTRDVPEDVIVFGVPARVIKERWDESTGRKL